MTATMTKGEREDLQRYIRQREAFLVSAAKTRSGQLKAELENALAAEYKPANDPVWAEAAALADREVAKAQRAIAGRCLDLGIAVDFAPRLAVQWYGRGATAMADR